MRRCALLITVAWLFAACEMLGLTTSAAKECAAPGHDYGGVVVGSFNTTVGAIRRLEPRPFVPALWPDLAPDHLAVLCYIDAEIGKAPPPPPNGPPPDPFNRAVVGVVDGASQMIMAGYRDQLPVKAP